RPLAEGVRTRGRHAGQVVGRRVGDHRRAGAEVVPAGPRRAVDAGVDRRGGQVHLHGGRGDRGRVPGRIKDGETVDQADSFAEREAVGGRRGQPRRAAVGGGVGIGRGASADVVPAGGRR